MIIALRRLVPRLPLRALLFAALAHLFPAPAPALPCPPPAFAAAPPRMRTSSASASSSDGPGLMHVVPEEARVGVRHAASS